MNPLATPELRSEYASVYKKLQNWKPQPAQQERAQRLLQSGQWLGRAVCLCDAYMASRKTPFGVGLAGSVGMSAILRQWIDDANALMVGNPQLGVLETGIIAMPWILAGAGSIGLWWARKIEARE